MLITSNAIAQKETIFNKSYEVNSITSVHFNLENIAIAIETSKDNKLHFDFQVEFSQYSKTEIKQFIEQLKVETYKQDNTIVLNAASLSKVVQQSIQLDSPFGITFEDDFLKLNNKEKEIAKKSEDSIINEINGDLNSLNYKFFKVLDKDGNKSDLDLKNTKMYKSKFVIQIPSNLKLIIEGTDTQITFNSNITNAIKLNLKQGFVKGKTISNTTNTFIIHNANFKMEHIIGGKFKFNNVSKGLIGSLSEVEINSEFSKIEIGKIGKANAIKDFNSEYWFYNWDNQFENFHLNSEYSKLHYFHPETDYSLSVIGNNTKSNIGKMKVELQKTKTNEKFNMIERKSNGIGIFSGAIYFEIVHGVIYSY
jgi:hypothetical protein